jgi:hypothetical protein
VTAPREGQQEVDGDRASRGIASVCDLGGEGLGPGRDPDRPESAGVGDRGRQLVARDPASHTRLDDRMLDSEAGRCVHAGESNLADGKG